MYRPISHFRAYLVDDRKWWYWSDTCLISVVCFFALANCLLGGYGYPDSISGNIRGDVCHWSDDINMISLFGLIMALGIVVDDAIVIGEHAEHLRRHRNLNIEQAAILSASADGSTCHISDADHSGGVPAALYYKRHYWRDYWRHSCCGLCCFAS